MKVAAIVQARLGSTRLQEKMLKDLSGQPLIFHVFERLKSSQKVNFVGLATTLNPIDQTLATWADDKQIPCFRGSEDNVLDRYYQAAKNWSADTIVRVTADDPFKDGSIIDAMIHQMQTESLDFITNNNPPSFPEGMDVEIFTFEALQKAWKGAKSDFEKEHVTQYFYKHSQGFRWANYSCEKDYSGLRWTIDSAEDLEMARAVYERLYAPTSFFNWEQVLELFQEDESLALINQGVSRSHMYKKQ